MGHKAQVVGDGLFKPNEALEGNGVFGELPNVEVGVAAQASKIKINAGIPQADTAEDGDVQAKLLPGDCVEENGFNRAGGIGRDRTELRKFFLKPTRVRCFGIPVQSRRQTLWVASQSPH